MSLQLHTFMFTNCVRESFVAWCCHHPAGNHSTEKQEETTRSRFKPTTIALVQPSRPTYGT